MSVHSRARASAASSLAPLDVIDRHLADRSPLDESEQKEIIDCFARALDRNRVVVASVFGVVAALGFAFFAALASSAARAASFGTSTDIARAWSMSFVHYNAYDTNDASAKKLAVVAVADAASASACATACAASRALGVGKGSVWATRATMAFASCATLMWVALTRSTWSCVFVVFAAVMGGAFAETTSTERALERLRAASYAHKKV